jgi:DNA-binding GntR family transcriptional regulator
MMSNITHIAEQLDFAKARNTEALKDQNFRASRNKLSAKAFEHIIGNIANGNYPPSSRISPKEIAGQLEMSLAPVRDAMEQLEQDGWIIKLPQKGTYVRYISLEDIEQIYELRQILEVGAIQIAITKSTPEYFLGLKGTVDSLITAAKTGDLQTYENLDTQFHIQLVRLTGNDTLIKTFMSVLLKTRCFFVALKTTSYEQQSTNDLEEISVSHKHIYEAMVAKQKEQAEQLLRQHIAVSCEWNKARIRIQQLAKI